LTFAWKLAVGPGDPNEYATALAQFLRQSDFGDIKTERIMTDDIWMVHAHKGECDLFVFELVSSNGFTKDLIRTFTGSSDEVFIVSRGSVHDYDSTWLAVTDEIYARILRKIGFARAARVLGVAAKPTCDARRLPWNKL
jgi:hypothetical protein